jgi:PadR family transcriptional regulator, regulatory protein AphA
VKSKPIKLTTTSYALLALLDQLGEATSYDIKQALDRSIENFWPVPHTTAYGEPARLAEGGYLSVEQEPAGRRRKRYSLTEEGREALRAWADETTAAPPQLRDEFVLKVFAGADPGPMVEERIAWHRAKLVELQGYLDAVRSVEGYEGSERTLVTGVAYHRMMIEMIEKLRDQAVEELAGR